jgi:Xaa-Pro dipeptidase
MTAREPSLGIDDRRFRFPFPANPETLARRRAGLATRLAAESLEAALLSYHRDVLYYTGTAQPANLLVPADRDPILFVRRAADLAREDVGEDLELVQNPSFQAVADALGSPRSPGRPRLGVCLDVIPAAHLLRLQKLFAGWGIAGVSSIVQEQRSVKDTEEIAAIERAAGLASATYETIHETMRPGTTEVELAASVGRALRLAGAEENVFFRRWDAWLPPSGIFVAGSPAAVVSGHAMTVTGTGASQALPWGPSHRPIRAGEVCYVDIGANFAGYHGDFTRSYVAGRADGRAHELFEISSVAQEAAIDALAVGVQANAPMLAARDAVVAAGMDAYFQGYGTAQGDYVGHGVGLELDEEPTLTSRQEWPLQLGMCLAIETKLIVPEWGGIGIEDTVVLEEAGPRLLTKLPRELIEVAS